MDKKQFRNIEDFLADSSFRYWVLHEKEVRSLYWDAWLKANPDKDELFHEAKELVWALEGNNPELEEKSENRIWDAISTHIEDSNVTNDGNLKPEDGIDDNKQKPWFPSFDFTPLRIAFILIFSGLIAIVTLYSTNLSPHFSKPPGEIPTENWITKTTNKGEKKKIHLPDGSKVIMNSDSELKYKTGFGRQHRELLLVGEAYFEVDYDTLLPFSVQSKNLHTIALGTSFTINSFPEKKKQEVKLFTGKVSVEHKNEDGYLTHALYLTPGEEALLTNHDFKKVLFDTDKALLWTKGILYFDETPLPEVVDILERWYGVEISVSGKGIANSKVTGEFRKDNLENVLTSIAYSSAFDFQINKKKVMIKMK
ncbi:FecR family protein [Belliella marina]|uniref:FecR family protein n=1 Tax=Belliella marina TaxID=1644146 RepID=A0ABW4VGL5_9BACT